MGLHRPHTFGRGLLAHAVGTGRATDAAMPGDAHEQAQCIEIREMRSGHKPNLRQSQALVVHAQLGGDY
ncbi:hypothetical protein GCM10009719_09590 [Nocardioides kribbensis]